jgi:hypothetical protein
MALLNISIPPGAGAVADGGERRAEVHVSLGNMGMAKCPEPLISRVHVFDLD